MNWLEKIMWELIKYWLYKPTKWITKEIDEKWWNKKSTIWIKILNDDEVEKLLIENPQNHKEAWFENWWGSRFATIFDFQKSFDLFIFG